MASGPWTHPASVQTLALPAGTYGFFVPEPAGGGQVNGAASTGPAEAPKRDQDPADVGDSAHALRLPAMLISAAPTPRAAHVEFFPAPGTLDRWLCSPGDHIVVRVHEGDATLLLTSVRRQQDQPLAIDVTRLDQAQPVPAGQPPLRVMLHVQVLGDLFYNQRRAGPVHAGLAIEAFIVDCKSPDAGSDAEYRALTADGFETPWLTDGMLCGSRGRGVPLIGFAVRPRVQAARRRAFRCEGYFRRAGWVAADPVKGWCRSPLPDDPLEGMALQSIDLA